MGNPHHRTELGQILCDISAAEYDSGRPLLSALVVHKKDKKPGGRFFELAKELGKQKHDEDDEAYYADELNRVFAKWGDGEKSEPGFDTIDNAVTERNPRLFDMDETIGDAKTIFADQLYDRRVLAGQYRIIGDEPLGSGGMGEVWKATDSELGTTVAIKVLPPMMARDKAAIENLKREAMIGQQLTHPNICRLYGFHSDGNIKFLVMEFIDGQTLKEFLYCQEDRKLTWQELEPIARPVAEALDYAHIAAYRDVSGKMVKGVLHRDIKPANIMITKDGQAKLMDFGIAREIHNTMTQLTGRSSSLTPMYASPEQFRGGEMTAASDIYSFTAVLYECLAGKSYISPHGDLAYQVLHKEFEPIDVDDKINNALSAGLAKEHQARPAAVCELFGLRPKSGSKVHSRPESSSEIISLKNKITAEKTLADVVPVKTDTELQWKRCKEMYTGKDFAELIEKGERDLVIAQTLYKEKAYSDAISYYESISRKCVEIEAKAASKDDSVNLGNGIKMEFVLIPPGEFTMGSPSSESQSDFTESPQRTVRITKPFYMGVHEVTQAEYQAIMDTNPSHFKGDNLPVECVSWYDAVEFCNELSKKEGREAVYTIGKEIRKTFFGLAQQTEIKVEINNSANGYRLPTEAQWEYACRAGTSTAYYFGNDADQLGDYAWFYSNSGNKTHPVGQKKPNAFGLYDMYGNVWQWCLDWYQDIYKGLSNTDSQGPNAGYYRVLRGGSWEDVLKYCRSASRHRSLPGNRNCYFGFRVVLVP